MFAFTSQGNSTAVIADLATKVAAEPGFTQDVADLVASKLSAVPEDRTIMLTVQGDLEWVPDQIAGQLSLLVLANVSN